MKIGLLGTGRLGICFALLLEQAGYEVVASDVREDYIKNLQQGVINTNEPDVQRLLSRVENITFKVGNAEVIEECDIIYTLVATPSLPDGSYDVSSVRQVIKDVKACPNVAGKSLVVGCTTNPGDCEDFQNHLKDYGVDVYYNPEFIAQGSIIKDLRNADMVLIGGTGKHLNDLHHIYHSIQDIEPKVYTMSTTAAELVKLAVNCFLTTKISYANMVGEVIALSGKEDEIETVLSAIGSDSRVGKKFLNFGYGYGGPCLPRDNRSFAAYAKKLGLEYNLGTTTDKFNEQHLDFLVDWLVQKNSNELPFAFPSVAYKNGTDILTESQQYRLCCILLDLQYKVYVVDDIVKDQCDSRITWGEPTEEVYWINL
tara:strand:+ start:1054 stop:2163 length:1110 start_codon:yes stop_codon:yes gene_type:complete